METKHGLVFAIAIGCTWCVTSSTRAEIVFDSIAPSSLGQLILQTPGNQAGNWITLAGTSRDVTRVDLALNSSDSASIDFRLNLWNPLVTPLELIWSSDIRQSGPLPYEPVTFSFDVPQVHVPETVGLTVEAIEVTGNPSLTVYNPAIIGTSTHYWLYDSTTGWMEFPEPVVTSGFRVFAVPEPTTQLLVSLVAIGILFRRR